MRARESFGVNHCTEFARNDQRIFAFFWDLVGARLNADTVFLTPVRPSTSRQSVRPATSISSRFSAAHIGQERRRAAISQISRQRTFERSRDRDKT